MASVLNHFVAQKKELDRYRRKLGELPGVDSSEEEEEEDTDDEGSDTEQE